MLDTDAGARAILEPVPLPPADLLRALSRVLRPIVRLLIRAGVTFPILADAIRGIYVDVAISDVQAKGRALTDSRISLLTGIHRKELRRQRAEPADHEPPLVTLHSQILARWLGDPVYLDGAGVAAALPRSGAAPSFETLVASVTRDVRSRTVLDEWLAQGLAAVDDAGAIVLRAQAFLPQQDLDARLYYFARNLHDHAQAAATNVSTSGPAPFLERSLHYDRLGPAAAAALERLAREAAQSVLIDINRAALALADADEAANPEGVRTHRVNFGVYVYREDAPDAP